VGRQASADILQHQPGRKRPYHLKLNSWFITPLIPDDSPTKVSAPSMPRPSTIPHPGIWSSIFGAFRQNFIPCLFLNALIAALVASYYFWPPMAGFWQSVADFKARWSYLFSCCSTIFSAVLFPFAVQWIMGTLPVEGRLKRLLLLSLFWGYRGMEIDLLYRIQGMLFGSGHDAATLVKKVAVDQFIYSTLWAVPTYAVVLRWIHLGGSWSRIRPLLDRHFWTHTCLTILFTNWLVWIPSVALVYSLPANLQFPVFAVVMCFFILLVTLLTSGQKAPTT